jgi:fimbrial chaperone protein
MRAGLALRLTAAAALAATGVWAPQSLAQSAPAVRVSPVNVELAAGDRAAALTLENEGDTETIFQIRPFAWSQADGAEKLDPTDGLAASPPFATIPAHGRQVVRLVLRRPAQDAEATYRILLDQTPPPREAGAGIRIALRLSIPVFALPAKRVSPDLQWRIAEQGSDAWLEAVNRGGRHEAVHGLKLAAADGRPLKVETGASPYVLAGATRRWRIDAKDVAATPDGALRLTASTLHGDIDQAVPLTHARP